MQFEGAAYHVFSRGNRRERIFRNEDDYAAFEDIMLEAMRWSGVLLYNWSQMPNHFHFNVETPGGNLSEFMQRTLTRYAKYFNRANRLVGHVFQGRYGAKVVDQESHFKEIVRYVELNPYRLKKGKLAELGAWKWSSWRYYRMPEAQWPDGCRQAFRQVLERFGADPDLARKNLAKLLADGLKEGNWEDFYKTKDRRFIGDEGFIERMKQRNAEPVRSQARDQMQKKDLEGLVDPIFGLGGLTAADLAAAGKSRAASRWRQALVFVARRFYRIPLVEIAQALGRSESCVSLMWGRHKEEIEGWPETQQLIRSLKGPEIDGM